MGPQFSTSVKLLQNKLEHRAKYLIWFTFVLIDNKLHQLVMMIDYGHSKFLRKSGT